MMRGLLVVAASAGALGLGGPFRRPELPFPIPHSPFPTSDTTITVRTTSSTLQFDPPAFSVRQGVRVRLRLVNEGTLPHNLVIVRDEADIDALADAASKQGGDYLPAALRTKMVAWTALASPGQTVEVSFEAPPPGTYPYVCLVSGHAMSMLGALRVLRSRAVSGPAVQVPLAMPISTIRPAAGWK